MGRPQAMSIEALLSGRRNRTHVKLRLVKAGLLPDRCAICGIDSWLGRPLSLCLHHVNGIGSDNRLENLALLCPNCHSQTENFAGKNMKSVRDRAALSPETARRSASARAPRRGRRSALR